MRRNKMKTGVLLCCVLMVLGGSLVPCVMQLEAKTPPRTISLAQVKSMALSNSSDYRKTKSRLTLQGVKYQQALKSVALKQKNKSSFRWTPLLSFKLPEKSNLSEESEYIFKPMMIQTETSVLQHKLTDIRYQTQETVCNLYVTLYTQQEKIDFYEKRITEREKELGRNQARLLTGEAFQADVDSMEKSLTELETKLAAEMRAFESSKAKMSDLIRLDITSGWRFSNPYVEASIERRHLASIIQHTIENDQQLYEAKLDTAEKLAMLDTNYALMSAQYGHQMGLVSPYISQVKRGEKLDSDSFKRQYDALLQSVDRPWEGQFRILFFRFSKEWRKGQISGIRYVEDEPYLLYTNALDYQEALETQKQTQKELEQNVREGYENLITARNSYQALQKETLGLQQKVQRGTNLNLAGELPYEELQELQTELEEVSLEELEAFSTYSQFLYSYDRLTCGAITQLLQEEKTGLGAIEGGISYVSEEAAREGVCYYIQTRIEDQVFELGVYVPKDYELTLTDYELWCDDIRIGERTALNRTIRHLFLDLQNTQKVFLRFYDGDDFIDDCEIDPQQYSGPLSIVKDYLVVQETDNVWGNFTCRVSPDTQMLTIKLTGKEAGKAAYYRIQDENGKALFSDELREMTKEFPYLSLVEADLERLTVQLYDREKKLLADTHMNLQTMELCED